MIIWWSHNYVSRFSRRHLKLGALSLGEGGNTKHSPADQLRIGDENVVISASLDTGDIIISGSLSSSKSNSTASFGHYIGDGSQLTNIISSSYAITASHALNSSGGGIFSDVDGYKQTINNLIISESNASSSLSVINSS